MNIETKDAIKALTKKAEEARTSLESLQLSQAALNLVHIEATLAAVRIEENKNKSF